MRGGDLRYRRSRSRSRSRSRDAHRTSGYRDSRGRDFDRHRDRDRDRGHDRERDSRRRSHSRTRNRDQRDQRASNAQPAKSDRTAEAARARKRSRSPSAAQPESRNSLTDLNPIKRLSEIRLQPKEESENVPRNVAPQVADSADDDAPLPDDLEIDFEDPDEKARREEEEARRQAEERRKRLESIKQKYSAQETVAVPDGAADRSDLAPAPAASGATLPSSGHDEEGDVAIAELAAEGQLLKADDEGEHLLREKLAVAAEEERNLRPVFDIFSSSPAQLPPQMQATGRRAQRNALLHDETHLASNWDDGEGYYRSTIGELLLGRYQVQGVLGKGVFSTVLKCIDASAPDDAAQQRTVAVKLIRNNETMRKAAEKEKRILGLLKDNKRFCIRMLGDAFEHRHHVGFVFEFQAMNLREALRKFGRDVGIAVSAVRIYGRQLMVALYHLASLRIVHADLKLDNILCSEDLKTVKLCDFGSAFFETDTDNDPTPYLVSRFYRAPEIVLGLHYDRSIDLWALCVCLYELFTGHVMFPGRSNNEMLRLVMEVKGKVPQKLLRQHLRAYETLQLEPHFSGDGSCKFRSQETDAVTGKPLLRLVEVSAQPLRPIPSLLQTSRAGSDEAQLVQWLADLLEAGLVIDPSKRIKVQDALKHPFFATVQSQPPPPGQPGSAKRK